MNWNVDEDELLKSLYMSRSREEIAKILGRPIGSVRKRCSTLNLNTKHPAVTQIELDKIKEWYLEKADGVKEDFSLDKLSEILGRTKQFISRLAGKMGMTSMQRAIGEKGRKTRSENTKKFIKEKGHTRGMLGKTQTDLWKKEQSARVSARIYTPEQREVMTDKMMNTKIERYGTGRPNYKESSNPYSRAKRGRREDLDNIFFRSAWEANYARYLNWLITNGEIKSWEFEPQVFTFHGETRGVISYMPDFKVYNNNGTYEWHEVKGWMTPKDRTKLNRMEKYYPNEKVILIDAPVYKAISKYKSMIDGWE